jgi:GT2 family glycosyltransferase
MLKAESIIVVTPTLGTSLWLSETISSVKDNLPNSTHIISCPESKTSELQARFPQVRVIADQGKQNGLYGAINAGIESVDSDWEWFTYINDDDLLMPGVGRLAERLTSTNANIMFGDVNYIDERGCEIAPIPIEPKLKHHRDLFRCRITPYVQQGSFFSRSVFERLNGFESKFRLSADFDFMIRALNHGFGTEYVCETVASFRIRAAQLSSARAEMIAECNEIIHSNLGPPPTAAFAKWTALRFKLRNLRYYIRRLRAAGFVSSERIMAKPNKPFQVSK